MQLGCFVILALVLGCSNNPHSQSHNELHKALRKAQLKLNEAHNIANIPQFKNTAKIIEKLAKKNAKNDKTKLNLPIVQLDFQSKELEAKINAPINAGIKILEDAIAKHYSSLSEKQKAHTMAAECYSCLAELNYYKAYYNSTVAAKNVTTIAELEGLFVSHRHGLVSAIQSEAELEAIIALYNKRKLDVDDLKEKLDDAKSKLSEAEEAKSDFDSKVETLRENEKELLEKEASMAMKAEELSKVSGKGKQSKEKMAASVKAGKEAIVVTEKIRSLLAKDKEAIYKAVKIAKGNVANCKRNHKAATVLMNISKDKATKAQASLNSVTKEKAKLLEDTKKIAAKYLATTNKLAKAYGKAKSDIKLAIKNSDEATNIQADATFKAGILKVKAQVYMLASEIELQTYRASLILENFNKSVIKASISKFNGTEIVKADIFEGISEIAVPAILKQTNRDAELKSGLELASKALGFAQESANSLSQPWIGRIFQASMNLSYYSVLESINLHDVLSANADYKTALNDAKANAKKLIAEAKLAAGEDPRWARIVDLENTIESIK